ncbi:lysozyme inhibitor LprI family protein [Sediminibacterium sp. TEGAF015]|uniref:lysozyme inhibitor LprI family protein n=1 Tax=Sediminibacterium sp. TEGAF015 TaxID=575378 RepID=UPI00220B0C5C|nr:lysozyme inhibitor LprI family protein [Sediminibacterium sp. TEGAF015]BDQ12598.1 hypothetical protein TEGAF0_18150 [Sediminibacterium sp. TEGAF015]
MYKKVVFFALFAFIAKLSAGQVDKPKELNPQIEFSRDTSYIEKAFSLRMKKDYTTVGMNKAIEEMTSSYDQLLNKYYNRLLKLLQPQDKITLVTAQKAWLKFRDAESKLIRTLSKEAYSGGGTIQSNLVSSGYADLVVKRCIDIFKYYDSLEKSEKY